MKYDLAELAAWGTQLTVKTPDRCFVIKYGQLPDFLSRNSIDGPLFPSIDSSEEGGGTITLHQSPSSDA